MIFYKSFILALATLLLTSELNSFAGATASQWVVVVNGNSDRSRTIANYYAHWRNIPSRNIVVLEDVPSDDKISVEVFREKILLPVLKQIETRRLESHIQGIAYSSDFPTAIDVTPDLKPDVARSQYLTPTASINGLTYLYRFVLGKQSDNYLTFANNFYARRPGEGLFMFQATSESEVELLKKVSKAKEENDLAQVAELFDKYQSAHPHQFPVLYASAQAWAGAGQPLKAMDRLQKAIEGGWSFAAHTKADPAFEALREQRRYQALLRSCEEDSFKWTPPIGFEARKYYSPNGVASADSKQGVSYMMSMVLAVCTVIGNTESEALTQLKTSILADNTFPEGIFYITDTSDVRTTCRKAGFPIAVEQLEMLDKKVEILPTILPTSKSKVLGVTMGTAVFAWGPSESKFVPGAIADNLTSLGGAMDNSQQTKLTEYLRHGAAAASGAVAEPYSLQVKFPHPTIHASYATGLTCAEAFYSSVAGPYQLLIVGDPLCQPFTQPPKFKLEGVEEKQAMSTLGRISFKPTKEANTLKPQTISVLLNGVLRGKGTSIGSVNLNDPRTPPGAHEVRFIGQSDTRVSERWEKSILIVNGTPQQQVDFTAPASWSKSSQEPLTVTVSTQLPDASITILHDWEPIATLSPGATNVELPSQKLGRGPVRLTAVAKTKDSEVFSLPVLVDVNP